VDGGNEGRVVEWCKREGLGCCIVSYKTLHSKTCDTVLLCEAG
jgi:hypothetical protein